MMEKLQRSPKDYDWIVLEGIDVGKALELCKKLGFEDSKIEPNIISRKIGDAGAASSLIALSKVLGSALPGQHVILCSYGAGAGADAMSLAAGENVGQVTGLGYEDYLAQKEYVDYTTYIKLRRILGRH
jgi:hydroxymethylglutaryl-CoA synthase